MLIQQLLNGLMLGSSYSLLAIGYTLIFGVLRLLHFAHGEVFMMGAFFGVQLVLLANFNIYLALIGAMVGTMLLGVLVELVAFRPIKREYHLAPLIATIGVAIVLQETAIKLFGAEQTPFPSVIKINSYNIGSVSITSVQILIFAISVFLMIVLSVFIQRTKLGKAMRAMAENVKVALGLGVNANLIVMATFAVASALAGAAGVLVGLAYGSISPHMGFKMALKGFAIMLLGGLGNITGAMLGGLIVGMIEVLSVAYLASSYRDAFSFGIMFVILILCPSGLFPSRIKIERA